MKSVPCYARVRWLFATRWLRFLARSTSWDLRASIFGRWRSWRWCRCCGRSIRVRRCATGIWSGLGLCFGFVTNVGGYYWIVNTLEDFSGFPFPVCVLFATIVWLYQASALLCFSLLYRRARRAGFDTALSACAAMVFAEWSIPLLFEHYFGASLHNVPVAIQVADLGGPLLVTALLTLANAGLYTLLRSFGERSRTEGRRLALREPAIAALLWTLTLAYGFYRIDEVDGRAAAAPSSPSASCKPTWACSQKREDPEEGWHSHLDQSVQLQREEKLDLLVWPESAFNWYIPEDIRNVRREVLGNSGARAHALRRAHAPRVQGQAAPFNTAFLADARGNITGTLRQALPARVRRVPALRRGLPHPLRVVAQLAATSPRANTRRPLMLGDITRSAR